MALVLYDKPMEIPDIMKWIAYTILYYVSVANLYDERVLDYSTTEKGQRDRSR
jgi:hypothetical protein